MRDKIIFLLSLPITSCFQGACPDGFLEDNSGNCVEVGSDDPLDALLGCWHMVEQDGWAVGWPDCADRASSANGDNNFCFGETSYYFETSACEDGAPMEIRYEAEYSSVTEDEVRGVIVDAESGSYLDIGDNTGFSYVIDGGALLIDSSIYER